MARGIAEELHKAGAEIASLIRAMFCSSAFSLSLKASARSFLLPCDVTDQSSIEAAFAEIEKKWGKIDFLVHAIAFSDKKNSMAAMSIRRAKISAHGWIFRFIPLPLLFKSGASDERWRQHRDLTSLWRRTGHAALQRQRGCCESRLECSVKYLAEDLGRNILFASTRSRQARLKTLAASGIGDFRFILKME